MTERMSITLEPEHVRTVERLRKRLGIKTFSGALQSLIHQFDQGQKAVDPNAEPADPKLLPAEATTQAA